jgi:Skp family chaperone for outer membrane proteins
MKSKMTALVVLITLMSVIFATGAQKAAAPVEGKCLKIAVVSVRKIFQDCRRNVKYRQEMLAERDKMEAELDKLSKEIDLGKAGLKTLKPNSSDDSASMKEIFEKQGRLQAQQEFFKRQMDMREQTVIESLFKDVVGATAEVARQKGIDLVLEKSDPDLPASNSNELTLTISTYKVLFNSSECEDITETVLAKVDANTP